MKVDLICTGGTISMTSRADHGALPSVTGVALAKSSGKVDWLNVHQIANVGGPALTANHLTALLTKIEECQTSSRGIVVTVGTDAIEEVAFFLSLVLTPSVPIVLTGAMRPHDHASSDGPTNIARSVDAIVEGIAPEVHVSFGGKLYPGCNVVKSHTSRLDAFSRDPNGRRLSARIGFTGFALPVVIVKPSLLDDLTYISTHDLKALVIEAGGEGNVPAVSEERILQIADRVPVLMTSRVTSGPLGTSYGYPGGSRRLVEAGVIASRRSSPKLRIMASLAVKTYGSAAREFLAWALRADD